MTLIHEPDPAPRGRQRPRRDAHHRRSRGHGPGGHLCAARRRGAGIDIPKLCERQPRGLRVLSPVPGRGRGRQGHPGLDAPPRVPTAWSCAPTPTPCTPCGTASWSSTSPTTRRTAPGAPAATARSRRSPCRPVPRRSATAAAARATSTTPRTRPTPISPTTPGPASSATGACAPAARSRAPSRSPSMGGASTPHHRRRHELPRLRMRLLRRLCPGLPDRRAHREVRHQPRHAHPLGGHHLCLLRSRLLLPRPRSRAPATTPGRPDAPAESRWRQRGHSCVKGRFAYGYARTPTANSIPWSATRSTTSGRSSPGRRRSTASRPVSGQASRRSTASAPSAASPRRGAPTRRSMSSRRWCVLPSATTTSIPVPGSATPHRLWPQPDLRHERRHTELRLGRVL